MEDGSAREIFVLQTPVNRNNLVDALTVFGTFRNEILPTLQCELAECPTECSIPGLGENKMTELNKFEFSVVPGGHRVVFPRGPVNLLTDPIVGPSADCIAADSVQWICTYSGVFYRNSPSMEDHCSEAIFHGNVFTAVDRIGADGNWLVVIVEGLGRKYLPITKDGKVLFKKLTEVGMQSFDVGCSIQLSSDYQLHGDAASGPLRPGDVGILMENDDTSSQPFLVDFDGKRWWYARSALQAADTAVSPSSPHTSSAAKLVFIPHGGNNSNSAWAIGALPISGSGLQGSFGWCRGGNNSRADMEAAAILEIAEREGRTCSLSIDYAKLELKLEIPGEPGQPPHTFTKCVPETEFPLRLGICGHQGTCITVKSSSVSRNTKPGVFQSSMFHCHLTADGIRSAIKEFQGKENEKGASKENSKKERESGLSSSAIEMLEQLDISPDEFSNLDVLKGFLASLGLSEDLLGGEGIDNSSATPVGSGRDRPLYPPSSRLLLSTGGTSTRVQAETTRVGFEAHFVAQSSMFFEPECSSSDAESNNHAKCELCCEPFMNQCSIDLFLEPLLLPIRNTIETDASISGSLPSFMSLNPYVHFSQMDISETHVMIEALSKQAAIDSTFTDREIVQEQQQEREEQKEVQTFQVVQPQGDRDPQRDCSWQVA